MLRLLCLAAAFLLSAEAFAPLPNAAPATRLTTMALARSAPPAIMAARAASPKKTKAVVKKVAPKKKVVKKVVKKKIVRTVVAKKPAAKKPVAKKAPPKPKPRPRPKPRPVASKKKQSYAFGKMQARAAPKLSKSNPYRNKGTAIVAGGGEANPGGAAFAAFFLFLPWVGIFAKAGYLG